MPESLFNKIVDLFVWNFKLKIASQIFFNKFRKSFKYTCLQDTSRQLLLAATPIYSWVIIKTIFGLENSVKISDSARTFKQWTTLFKDFIKHNSLKSDLFFNPKFIPCLSGSRFFRVQIFQGPGFSRSRFLRAQVFWFQVIQGPGFSRSGSRVRIQVLEVVQNNRVRNLFTLKIIFNPWV